MRKSGYSSSRRAIAGSPEPARRSAAAILKGISPAKFDLFRKNPEQFIAKAEKLIVQAKATMIVKHITYRTLDDRYDSAIFTQSMLEDSSRAVKVKKNTQDYVFPDGMSADSVEKWFAEDMDADERVAVYAKLPRSFQIPNPVGNYAPDWAIAFKKGTVKHVFFVAVTKGTMDTMQLKGVEQAKIQCAEKLFNEMSGSDVRYHQAASYEDLLAAMGDMD